MWPQIPKRDSPEMVVWCVASETSPGIPMCDSPGMVGVTVVCGLRDPGAAVLGWWELLWCVASETLVRQSWDGGSYCGVWPQRPLCGSPGMVGVTVVCGPRDPCAAVLRWWELIVLGWSELLWCVASETLVRQSWDGESYCAQIPMCDSPGMVVWCVASETLVRQSWDGGSYCGVWPQIPTCDSHRMVVWCVASETLVRQSWDGGSYCGVWPQRPLCGSPGMVGVTVVCGPRDPCAAVLRWWELIMWCVASDTHV